jgi:hypothetical protein
MSLMVTAMPKAVSSNQRRLGSAAVMRKVLSSRRETVPSSMTMPSSLHQVV